VTHADWSAPAVPATPDKEQSMKQVPSKDLPEVAGGRILNITDPMNPPYVPPDYPQQPFGPVIEAPENSPIAD
jgi:hypothetical protein